MADQQYNTVNHIVHASLNNVLKSGGSCLIVWSSHWNEVGCSFVPILFYGMKLANEILLQYLYGDQSF